MKWKKGNTATAAIAAIAAIAAVAAIRNVELNSEPYIFTLYNKSHILRKIREKMTGERYL
jgi:hypothetical protein